MDPKRQHAVKVLIIIIASIIGVVVLSVVGIAGAGYYWWRHNGPALEASAKTSMREGEAAGHRTDEQGCLDQAEVRMEARSGVMQIIENQGFLTACLSVAQPSPGLCDSVPAQMEFRKSVQWRLDKCPATPDFQKHAACSQLVAALQSYCDPMQHRRLPDAERPK